MQAAVASYRKFQLGEVAARPGRQGDPAWLRTSAAQLQQSVKQVVGARLQADALIGGQAVIEAALMHHHHLGAMLVGAVGGLAARNIARALAHNDRQRL